MLVLALRGLVLRGNTFPFIVPQGIHRVVLVLAVRDLVTQREP